MSRSALVMLGILGIVAIAAIAYVAVVINNNPRPPPQLVACVDALPKNANIGIDVSITNGKDVTAKFGQSTTTVTRDTEKAADVIDALSRCVVAANGILRVEGTVIQEETPIGFFADLWANDPKEATVTLRLGSEEERRILSNLRVGPNAGTKEEIMKKWCAENSGCIDCKPTPLRADLVNYEISLKPGAVTQEVPMSKQPWPVPGPQTRLKGWELVDATGHRTIYVCKAPAG